MSEFPEKEPGLTEETEEVSTVFSDPTTYKATEKAGKKKRWPAIIASLLAVAILVGGTVAVIKLIPEKDDDDTPDQPFETVQVLNGSADDLKTVTVTNPSGTFQLYSQEEENTSSSSSESTKTVKWYLDGYDPDVIDSYSLSGIASDAAKLEAIREVPKSAADCGLDQPPVKVAVVKNDGTEYAILVGAESPDNSGVYVKLSTEEKIYIAEVSAVGSFDFDALSLADTAAIPAVDLTDVASTYKSDDGKLTSFDRLTLSGVNFPEKLVLVPNTDSDISAYAAYLTLSPTKRIADHVDDIFGLFSSGVSVAGAYSFDTSAASRKALGLASPDLAAEMTVGGKTFSYAFKKQADGDYAVWYNGAKLIKKVSASSLSFIDYTATDYYASWVCLQSINELSGFTVKTPEKTYAFGIEYHEEEDAEETYVITYNGQKLVAENFQNFYQYCISLACSDFTVDALSGTPEITMIFTYSDTSRGSTTVEFRKASETKFQYSIDGIAMGKVTASSLNKLLKYAEKTAAGEAIG